MKKTTILFASIVGLLIVLGGWFMMTNNSLIGKDEAVKASWSQVQNVYQHRLNLIPNVMNTVRAYAAHERQTFAQVIMARSKATSVGMLKQEDLNDPKKLKEFDEAQSEIGKSLGRLLVVSENYPNLKADNLFRDLVTELEGVENRISVERRRFNESVKDFNTSIRVFPQSIVASQKGFTEKAYFEAQPEAQTAPKVDL